MSKLLTWRTWQSAILQPGARNPQYQRLWRTAMAECVEIRNPRCHRGSIRSFARCRSLALQDKANRVPTPQSEKDEIYRRIVEVNSAVKNPYPRYITSPVGPQTTSIKSLITALNGGLLEAPGLTPPQDGMADAQVRILGRVSAIRTSGSKLAFIDVVEDQLKLQIVLSWSAVKDFYQLEDFKRQCALIRRGDVISINGFPHRASNGQASIKATSVPELQAPCLHRFPVEERGFSTNPASNTHFRERHVEMLADPSIIETIKARATIIKTLRTFLESKSFVEVQTPILSGNAGGATARPFKTIATEFSDGRDLTLRIAPELWLKRLIIGGMDRVFEIGPSFRNEGLDKTHNPEFSSCEFYAVGHNLNQLMQHTEELLGQIARSVESLNYPFPPHASSVLQSVQGKFQVLNFIPALIDALGQPLPHLESLTAQEELLEIFKSKDLPLPSIPTIPRLLDKLSSIYLEPQSLNGTPTWITNIPGCMSPLAKSEWAATSVTTPPQEVALRAELFINGREVVNCYEEENSPIQQGRKFEEQQTFFALQRNSSASNPRVEVDDEAMPEDASYLQALEWGLPPTGGWGCGIDRLVMLFTGRERISDVLTFGSLRHVTHRPQGYDKVPQVTGSPDGRQK